MDFHFDRKIVYSTDREFKNLYDWSLKELNSDDQQVGKDWIPWPWTLVFNAIDISLHESWSMLDRDPVDDIPWKNYKRYRKFMRAELRPIHEDFWSPSYSMFGTQRKISKFYLHIEQILDNEDETCTAYGIVENTSEIEFREYNDTDCLRIQFNFHSVTFDQYANRISSGEIDSLTVLVGEVSGAYSAWSPTTSTQAIKILTADREHKVEGLAKDVNVCRLGKIGEAELRFTRGAKLPLLADEADEPDESDIVSWDTNNSEVDLDATVLEKEREDAALLEKSRELRANETAKLIENLRIAMWVVVALLVALLLK